MKGGIVCALNYGLVEIPQNAEPIVFWPRFAVRVSTGLESAEDRTCQRVGVGSAGRRNLERHRPQCRADGAFLAPTLLHFTSTARDFDPTSRPQPNLPFGATKGIRYVDALLTLRCSQCGIVR